MTYAVTFTHARHRTKFETLVKAANMDDALRAGEAILVERIGATAGQPTGWSHAQTEEVAEGREL